LKILAAPRDAEETGFDEESADNRIIRVAYRLHRSGERVIFVSKDINARVKADAVGIRAEDFEREKVNLDELYTGYASAVVGRETIERLYAGETVRCPELAGVPNQFYTLTAEDDPLCLVIARMAEDGSLREINHRLADVYTIQARNIEQRMALELLMDPAVNLVTLVGQAGTGKTLLAIAAGLELVLRQHLYDRILVSRPIIPLGKDIGYLPGPKEEKLAHWMEPIFDNLAYLLRDPQSGTPQPVVRKGRSPSVKDRIQQLLDSDVIELEALTYIRGRSISRQFILIDEAQNLTPHEVKTVVSRAGEGSKIVLTGDPYQIDNPYLDAASNGLIYVAERLKTHAIHGHVTLSTSERGDLAALAARCL